MVKVIRSGTYKLIETKNYIKILYLDEDMYAWPETLNYGEMLVVSRRAHKTDAVLSVGHYIIYEVVDDDRFSNHIHLELEVGNQQWQGYLLLTGLPNDTKKRSRIIPTHETITGSRFFEYTNEPAIKRGASPPVPLLRQ